METTVLSGAGARKDVHALLDRIIDRGKPVTYNRVKALVSRIFKHGIDREWLDHNPAAGIPKKPERSRERVLPVGHPFVH
jgi:hypothetical protein